MGAVKDSLEYPTGCPGCGLIPEKVWGTWWPHAPGDLQSCRGLKADDVNLSDLCKSGGHNFGFRKQECLYCGAVPK